MFMKPRHTGIALMGLLFSGLMLSHTAAAGVSTTLDSATNPDYIGFQLSTVVIRIDIDDPDGNIVLEHFLKKELGKQGITVHLYDDLFPTTQAWNEESMQRVYKARSIDGVLLVQRNEEAGMGSSHRSHAQAGHVRYSATSKPTRSDQPSGRYGGGPIAAAGYSESVRGSGGGMHAQRARYHVELLDWTQGREVWHSSIETHVTGDHSKHQKMAKGTALGIIRGLTESEHMPQG